MNDNNTYKKTETEDELLHIDEISQITKSVPVRRKCKVKRIQANKTSPSESKETVGLKEIETEQKSSESKNQNSQYQPASQQNLLSNQRNQPYQQYPPQNQQQPQQNPQYQQYPPQYQQNQPYQQYPPQYQQNQSYQQYPPQYQQNQPYQQNPYNQVNYPINQQVPSQLCCERCGSHNVVIRTESEKHLSVGAVILMAVLLFVNICLLFIPILDIFGIIMIVLIIVAAIGSRKTKITTYAVCQNCGYSCKLE